MTPLQYRKAQIWTDNTVLNINNYDYEYWKDSGNGTMIITANANNGSFSCEWHNINNIVFRSGKKFKYYDRTHKQLGNISLKYDAAYNSNGISYLALYGWTVDPLIEWYIIECYAEHNPARKFKHLGAHDTDGGTYELYCTTRENGSSILGVRDFGQYWSIRTVGRFSGTVNVSAHLCAWENMGLTLGNLTETALSVEGWQSSGKAAVNTNILTIKPIANMEVTANEIPQAKEIDEK
uniref:Endo-1,4-beta-xylanase n=1 Tax=uncultured Bacillus sp. TaxID=83428 RepID=W8E7J6_9BACI|nr:glycosyl hydrolase family 11 xylanase [uncultured Bacillus sp.]